MATSTERQAPAARQNIAARGTLSGTLFGFDDED
jgi:hypothetical protein